jgi:DNA-directed RNA polymerase subunit RPC12/RpoP
MSEFKYACPVCGQHIKCDSSQAGTVMECPTCFQKITVPQAPSSADSKFIITGTKVGAERPMPSVPADSGSPPPPPKHFPLAVFFVILLCAVAGAAIVFRGQISRVMNSPKPAADQTNQPPAPVAVTAPPPKAPPPKPVVIAPPANDTNWTLELSTAVIPDAPAAGRIHAGNFICERAILDTGTLSLRMAARDSSDLGVSIYLHANQSADLAGRSVNITSAITNAPRVRLRWREDDQKGKTEDFHGGYALKIEFGRLAGNRLPGKLYLCTPDDGKSYVAGTFNAEIHKPRPPKP